MRNKAGLLFLYFLTLYLVLHRWYSAGNQGAPQPNVMMGPTYLFGLLILVSGALPGSVPLFLGAGATWILYLQTKPKTPPTHPVNKTSTTKKVAKKNG